ncbi:MAG: hypothetical protein COT25_01240 [Candidatus Kerfeldbacteria bacterium CG08_land_8_20_14_0_20_42_7]|uniref:Ribulose-phosphate 3-epimerase n=1 Tax=Candidatus Kerfeldbacteria bacterium CG08_land_8_20_14_0_20_42_7 TaxID=2014245 RepID=A0A2H0YTK1_9BACT|nr:MAG: hypothetical protein COT25_01240 [Candidatus Kerfeldbacteria bacterium CG08_land_8_20_14_0_20_42_7]
MNVEIIPAIVPMDEIRMTEQISQIRAFAQTLQVDITDGIFTPHKTLQSVDIPESLLRGLSYEVHIMAEQSDEIVNQWIRRSPKRIIIHAETHPSALLLQQIEHEGIEPMIALLAPSSLTLLDQYLHLVQSILFLSIDPPGDQGRSFIPNVLKKMRDFHILHASYAIEADGGINEETMQKAMQSGATRLVVGSELFSNKRPPDEEFIYLTQLAHQYANDIFRA